MVCLDADESSVQDRTEEAQDFLQRENVKLENAQLILIVMMMMLLQKIFVYIQKVVKLLFV